ncbi:MAG: transketolase [Clostridiales bacterium]|jgi:transketolase|nr:transketolase [Clostridiales bacterium]
MMPYDKTFYNELLKLMLKNGKIIFLHADQAGNIDHELKTHFPTHYINFGIGENNMIAAACALAKDGLVPLVCTQGAFLAYRSFEFIRVDCCIQNMNIKIIAMGAGVKNNTLGPTHHATEDIAAMRVLPNLTILSPASPLEIAPALDAALAHNGPVYLRLGKAFETEIYTEPPKFKIGVANLLSEGSDLTIIATGNIIASAIYASDKLSESGISCDVINMSTIKPLDVDAVLRSAIKTRNVVTIEEHQIIGGLGGAVAEVLAQRGIGAKLERIGFNDEFATTYGWHKDILENYDLLPKQIYKRIVSFLRSYILRREFERTH